MIWFPELFYRFEEFEQEHAGIEASVCDVSSIVLGDRGFCTPIDNKVYWHTIIIGLSCIPTSLLLPVCIHRLGAKFFISKFTLSSACVCSLHHFCFSF
jgi:MFS transporter, VNT family, synaptic vesicle glycoprotein 2